MEKYCYHYSDAKKMSREARYFLNLCLAKDWRIRVDADTLLKHPWIKQSKKLPLTQSKHQRTIANLVSFKVPFLRLRIRITSSPLLRAT